MKVTFPLLKTYVPVSNHKVFHIQNCGRKPNCDTFLKSENINFCRDIKKSAHPYDEFLKEYEAEYGKTHLEDTVKKIIETSTELNHGREKRVFNFPKMDKYLIGYFYKIPQKSVTPPIRKSKINYPEYNFSEPIASNNYDTIIVKKIEGFPNSVNDFHGVKHYIIENGCVTEEMAHEYLSKLRKFKDFPQSSYDDFAHQIKYLDNKGLFIDYINPNNIIVDTKNKKFHYIDLNLGEGHIFLKGVSDSVGGIKSGAYDMINLLLDRFQCYYLDKMTPDEQKETVEISKQVIQKCLISADKFKLPKTNLLISTALLKHEKECPELHNIYSSRYDEFLKLYKSVLN